MLLVAGAARGQEAPGRVVWRGLLGDAALEVRVAGGNVQVGAASDSATVSVSLRASDVRRFADSLQRRITTPRRGDTTWSLRVEEPGVSAGTLALSRVGTGPDRQPRFGLLVADDPLVAVRQGLDRRQALLVLRALRDAARPPRAPARRAAPNASRRRPG